MNCSSVNSIQRIARVTGSRFYDSSVYGYRAGSVSPTSHTGISAHRDTQNHSTKDNHREEQQQRCAAEGKITAGLHLSSHPVDSVPPTDFTRSALVSCDLLSFNDCMAAGLTKTARPHLSVHHCCSQRSPLLSRRRNCLLPREAPLGFPVAWNRTAALWPGLSFKNNSYTTANYHEANKQVIQTSKIVKELVSCCFSSTEIKSCYSGFIPVIFEASFSLRFPNPFIELRVEFLFPKFHINMTTLKQTRIVYLKADKHFADERQTL